MTDTQNTFTINDMRDYVIDELNVLRDQDLIGTVIEESLHVDVYKGNYKHYPVAFVGDFEEIDESEVTNHENRTAVNIPITLMFNAEDKTTDFRQIELAMQKMKFHFQSKLTFDGKIQGGFVSPSISRAATATASKGKIFKVLALTVRYETFFAWSGQ